MAHRERQPFHLSIRVSESLMDAIEDRAEQMREEEPNAIITNSDVVRLGVVKLLKRRA